MNITENIVTKLLNMIDLGGLCHGAGNYPEEDKPASFCVQQAVSLALGEEDAGSYPVLCVGQNVKDFGVRLNDKAWVSQLARGKGMRRFAVAELGSNNVSQNRFEQMVCDMWNIKHDTEYDNTGEILDNAKPSQLAELAETAVRALIILGTEGSHWLGLCEPKKPKVAQRTHVPQLEWKQYGRQGQATHACHSS